MDCGKIKFDMLKIEKEITRMHFAIIIVRGFWRAAFYPYAHSGHITSLQGPASSPTNAWAPSLATPQPSFSLPWYFWPVHDINGSQIQDVDS